ncbi:polyadenylation/uridylation factor 2 [Trypanosoma theileri]|uniref:Polyadenylation/uridylation factor 2 n=1 Tax=Trypanosoma theileri TaxID=67003 RepID=A0A1X0NVZ4_9TRYP|nr:polyadenylation/uridylation factor 2 [Trypanosoma theileri]ORC88379.1 polyadenylation/uridylation factor 2 [Trypanosoma theileri]
MRRWLLDNTCRITLILDLQRYVASTPNDSTDHSSGKRDSKSRVSFGIDQKKLDLMLNLHEADFGAMVKATRNALAKEKKWREATIGDVSHTKDNNSNIEKSEKDTVSTVTHTKDGDVDTSPGPSSSMENNKDDIEAGKKWMESRTVRGIVGAGAAHDTNSMFVVQQQRKAEGARFSLMDALRDCVLSGNWAKAMRLFESAIETSYKSIRGNSFTASSSIMNKNLEKEDLDALRRINATTPPGAISINLPNHRGILRWGGGHYYLLLKLLLSRHRVTEAERVWEVMKGIGFVEFHMDERLFNQCIALARKTPSSDIVLPLVESKKDLEDQNKTFRRTFVIELEQWAKQKELQLDARSKHTTQAARLAQMIKNSEHTKEMESSMSGLDTDGLKVGDFSGLLRRCVSEENTSRVLQMMDKLNIPRDGQIYSALIAALRNPNYRLAGDTISTESNAGNTKEEFDAHRKRRIERASEWFAACPESERTADVYNEMLHITRGGKDEDEMFNRLLIEFRGAPLLPPTATTTTTTSSTETSATMSEDSITLVPPQWRVPPNGHTYEILVMHYIHLQQWPVVWALYDEMNGRRIRGTQRLFHTLLNVAHRAPPHNRDPHVVVMGIYDDMKRSGVDVTGIKSTVNVVNAWCATRRRRRW